jgi:hypothetical protein
MSKTSGRKITSSIRVASGVKAGGLGTSNHNARLRG